MQAESVLCKTNLSLDPWRSYRSQMGWHGPVISALECWRQADPRAHWLVFLAEFWNFRFSERAWLKKWGALDRIRSSLPLRLGEHYSRERKWHQREDTKCCCQGVTRRHSVSQQLCMLAVGPQGTGHSVTNHGCGGGPSFTLLNC